MTNSERLATFRASYGGGELRRWMVALLAAVAAGFVALGALVIWQGRTDAATAHGAAPETLREHAALLAEKRLPGAAIALYADYLDIAGLSAEDRARIYLKMGELAQDDEQFEDALAYYYRANALGLGDQSEVDANRGIAQCLEQLGRTVDLRRELRAVRQDGEPDTGNEGPVLARAGDEVITERDLEYEIAALPPALQDEMNDPQRREELLRDMVARRLLREKAYRRGLDEDPGVQEELARMRDALLVRTLIEREAAEGVQVTAADVRRFYEAEKERFTRPATARIRVSEADSREAALQEDRFGEREVVIQAARPARGAPFDTETVADILEHAPGAVAGPYEIDGAWYAARLVAKQPEETLPFEQVRDQARAMYERAKEQERTQALIEEALQAEGVEIYADRLESGQESPS